MTKEKLYSQPRPCCERCGQCPPSFDQVKVTHTGFLCLWCIQKDKELLRVGMSGGRNLVETVKSKARRDTVTPDLLDVQERLF